MKILITTDLYLPLTNGVVISVLNLKKGLEELGHDVRILTLSQSIHSKIENGIYYIGSLSTSLIYPDTRLGLVMPRSFYNDIIAWKPDVVHSQCEISTFMYAKTIATSCKSKLVHTYHTIYEDYTHYFFPIKRIGKYIVSKLSKYVLNKTDVVIAPSNKVMHKLNKYGVKSTIHVIPTGIDYKRFSRIPSEKWISLKKHTLNLDGKNLILIYVGRLAKEKNMFELIKLFANCRYKTLKLLVVGDGPLRKQLTQYCDDLGVADKVVFTGMIKPNEVWKYYHLGDVFVNTSTSEAQGLTYIEAMASQLPLLCKKDECLKDLVENGINGWQFKNSTEFNKYIRILLKDSELYKKMAYNSSLKAKAFEYNIFAKTMIDVYK